MQKSFLLGTLLISALALNSCQSKASSTQNTAAQSEALAQIPTPQEKENVAEQKLFLWIFYTQLLAQEMLEIEQPNNPNTLSTLLEQNCTAACLQFLQQQDRRLLGYYDGYVQGPGALYFRIGGQDPTFSKQLASLRIEQGEGTGEFKVTMSDYRTYTSTLTLLKTNKGYQIDKVYNPHWDGGM